MDVTVEKKVIILALGQPRMFLDFFLKKWCPNQCFLNMWPCKKGIMSQIFNQEHGWQPGPTDAETDHGIEALAEAVSDGAPW